MKSATAARSCASSRTSPASAIRSIRPEPGRPGSSMLPGRSFDHCFVLFGAFNFCADRSKHSGLTRACRCGVTPRQLVTGVTRLFLLSERYRENHENLNNTICALRNWHENTNNLVSMLCFHTRGRRSAFMAVRTYTTSSAGSRWYRATYPESPKAMSNSRSSGISGKGQPTTYVVGNHGSF